MSDNPPSTLSKINPFDIQANADNPRILFDDDDLKYLQQSIKEVGVLVPLIVYRNKKKGKPFVLLDGERRLRCAKRLKLSSIPANQIDAPNKLQNLLLMFNIHNVRKDWELVPTALKLETVLRLLPKGKNTSSTHIAKITGMSTIRVSECKRILNFKRKYIDLALDPDSHRRVPGDFLSQLSLALDQLPSYPEITRKYTNDQIIDLMIKKYRDGTIVNFVNEFRMLKKILASNKKGVEKKVIINSFNEFLTSKQKKTSGTIIKKAMSMKTFFEKTSFTVYKEDELLKKSKELTEIISKFEIKKAKKLDQVASSLEKLSAKIDRLLDKIE